MKLLPLKYVLLITWGLMMSSCSKEAPGSSVHDGVYHPLETTEVGHNVADSGRTLPLLNYQLTLRDGTAKMVNLSTGQTVFTGPFSVSPSPRSSPMDGSEQINVTVTDEVFRPSLYTYKGKIYYLQLEGIQKSLTVFSR